MSFRPSGWIILGALGLSTACAKPLPVSASGSGVTYSACSVIGGYDRLRISKRDDRKGTCTRVTLASPSTGSVIPLTVPSGWSVEVAAISNQPTDCEAGTGLGTSFVPATGGTGSIGWPPPAGSATPAQLSIHVTLTFGAPAGASSTPPSDQLEVEGLPVAGCR